MGSGPASEQDSGGPASSSTLVARTEALSSSPGRGVETLASPGRGVETIASPERCVETISSRGPASELDSGGPMDEQIAGTGAPSSSTGAELPHALEENVAETAEHAAGAMTQWRHDKIVEMGVRRSETGGKLNPSSPRAMG